jgi:hypothetical protein
MVLKHMAQGKCIGDDPQWSKGKGDCGDEGRKEEDDYSIAATVAAVKHPNPNAPHECDEMDQDDVMMYITYPNLTAVMLTLNTTTLFYWTLSLNPTPKKMKFSVEAWEKSIPSNAKPTSCAPSQANSMKTGKSSGTTKHYNSTAPTLTSGTSSCSVTSVLTSAVTITSAAHVPPKIKQDPDTIYTQDEGGISDCEEITGVERAVAHASPIKGKKHLTSKVHTSTTDT